MKKRFLLLLIPILWCCPTPNFAQNSQPSTSTAAESNGPVDRNRILNRLIREAEASRKLVDAQREQLAGLDKQLELAEAAAGKQSETYKKALDEIWQLRDTIIHNEKALAAQQQQIDLLRADRDRYKAKYKTLRKILLVSAGVATFILLR